MDPNPDVALVLDPEADFRRRSTVFVGNLSYDATDKELAEFFADAGSVMEVRLLCDKVTGQSKGYGFIQMSEPGEAARAAETLNGATFKGRILRVNVAVTSGGGP